MRIGRVCLAVLMAAAVSAPAASAKELKPKFGNIDGVYYSDVAGNREACRQAIRNKIALCRQNVSFESNTKNRQYKGCLPIFRRQAQSCAVHFRHQMSKCDLSGAARITDFTGFSCEVTRTVVEEDSGPGIAPLDRRMAARTRVNLRAGPGTNHRVVGSLAAGQAVQTTGRAGDWLRIAKPGGGTAFVHGNFMVAAAGQSQERTEPKGLESNRVNPALASALRRCKAAASRSDAAARASLSCKRRFGYGTKRCKDTLRRSDAAWREYGNACCGSFRASSPGGERIVSEIAKSCAHYNGVNAYVRCMTSRSDAACRHHLRPAPK